jgi:ureidoglycolate lyase
MTPFAFSRRAALALGGAAAVAADLGAGSAAAATPGLPALPASPFATAGAPPAEAVAIHTTRVLPVEPVTPEAFAPFGVVLTDEGRERLPIDTYGPALDLYREGFATDQPIEWFIVSGRPRWNGVLFLERHMQLTQAFIPIAGAGFYTVVARPGAAEEGAFPALDELRAFHVRPGQAIQLRRGTWHENPMPAGADLLALVTSHAALTLAHQANPDPSLAGVARDLDRRWYKAGGFDVTLAV